MKQEDYEASDLKGLDILAMNIVLGTWEWVDSSVCPQGRMEHYFPYLGMFRRWRVEWCPHRIDILQYSKLNTFVLQGQSETPSKGVTRLTISGLRRRCGGRIVITAWIRARHFAIFCNSRFLLI